MQTTISLTKAAASVLVATTVLALAVASGSRPAPGSPPLAAPLPAQPGEYIVHWPEGTASALADMDGVTVLSTPGAAELEKLGAFVVRIDDGASLAAIMAAGAEYVEPNATFTSQGSGAPLAVGPRAADPLLGQQWFHDAVGSRAGWAATRGAGVRVAVVDSGVGPHAELGVVGGRDFTGGDGQWSDHFGHGTHVAGICCARGDNGQGGAGVAPLADVLSARVLDNTGTGALDAIAAGVVWSADQGARVINLSLGGPSGTRSLQEALAYAAGHGALVVCAAGNDGSTRNQYPAAFPDCLSVGASGRGDALAPFSNRAPTVDITAPGMGILSSCRGGGWCMMDGTSMAAPIVAGAAALVASAGVTDPAAISWRLRSTAAPRPALPGGRRVDVAAALAARPTALPLPPTLAPRPTPPPSTAAPSASPTATRGVRLIPVVVPPGCRVVVICEEPYPRP